MSKTITVVNSGNMIAQNFVKSISGFNRIILADCVNGRRSLIRNMNKLKQQDPNVKIQSMNINSPLLLEESIRDSNTVVYFTHDYYSFVEDKNKQLKMTADICKNYGVDKLVAVNPIEYLNYYNNDGFTDDPLMQETKVQDSALENFANTTILRSNLIFGTRSYFVRFLTQLWTEDFSFHAYEKYKSYRFNPIYYKDLNDMIQVLVTDTSGSFKGKKIIAEGNESHSLSNIDDIIKQTFSGKTNHSEPNKILHWFFKNWQLLFHGNTHIINFEEMLDFLHHKNPQLNDYEDASLLLQDKMQSFREYYTNKAEKKEELIDSKIGNLLTSEEPDDLRFPKVQNYWMQSLD